MSALSVMEGCTFGLVAALAAWVLVPSTRLGSGAAFLILLVVWLIAYRKESQP